MVVDCHGCKILSDAKLIFLLVQDIINGSLITGFFLILQAKILNVGTD